MPESITPMTTLREPVVTFHASGASMSASARPLLCPVLCKPQSCEKLGSLGNRVRLIAKSGSTNVIPGVARPQPTTVSIPAPGAVTA